MKIRILISLFFLLIYSAAFAEGDNKEKASGIWQGKLSIQGMEMRIVFNLEIKDDKLTGTLDSPDQGAKGIPLGDITFLNDSITIQVPSVAGFYKGAADFEKNKITGVWSQSGMSLPLDLEKTDKVEEVKRPQTPVGPFPYKIEEVVFRNEKDNINLAGTLTIPDKPGNYPVVIMVTGSGPQDRDESLLNHKPFWVIADDLSRNGIAVLRYDDRGAGKSEGEFSKSTTNDFVADANSAVEFIKTREEFKNSKIGIIGHSEGGLIAPLASVENKDIDFIVLIAGPALPGDEILRLQSRLIAKAEGADDATIERDVAFSSSIYEVLKSETDTSVISAEITRLFKNYYDSLSDEEKQKSGSYDILLAANLQMVNSPWFRNFVTYDPRPTLEKVTIPTLAIYGEKDLQVPAKENKSEMEKALKNNGNKETKVMELPGMNHLFQHAVTGSPTEYAKIEETFSPETIKIIREWIHSIK